MKKKKRLMILIVCFLVCIFTIGGILLFLFNRRELHTVGDLYKNSGRDEVICSTESDTPYKKGTLYTCDNLGDGKTYEFYVLHDVSDTDSTVDLIMSQDYNSSSYVAFLDDDPLGEELNYLSGPTQAAQVLPTVKDWKNVESPKNDSGFDYSPYAARLPMAEEIADACEVEDFKVAEDKLYSLIDTTQCSYLWENTNYLDSSIKYYGYFTSSHVEESPLVWVLYSSSLSKEDFEAIFGSVPDDVSMFHTVSLVPLYAGSIYGVRPVITLYK